MTLEKPKALVLADVPSPHQNVFFDGITDLGEVNLEVTFCRRTMPGRAWSGEGPSRTKFVVLPEAALRGVPTNPTLLPHLLNRPKALPFVIGYYLPGLLAAGLSLGMLRRRWVFWMDALQPLKETGSWARRQAVRRIRQWYLDHATSFLSTGNKGRQALLQAGVPAERCYEIPFVVDADWIHRAVDATAGEGRELRRSLGVSAGQRLLLFVGQMIHRKGIDLLIAAAKSLPESERGRLQFLMVGDGADKETFQTQVAAAGLGGQFHFRPNADFTELPRFWAASDALVLPSRFDAWGVVVDEALTAGLPVLGSDACGAVVDRVVPGENGWRYPADDVHALSKRLTEFASVSADRLRGMSNAARASMEPFSPRRMAHKFTEVLEATLNLEPRG